MWKLVSKSSQIDPKSTKVTPWDQRKTMSDKKKVENRRVPGALKIGSTGLSINGAGRREVDGRLTRTPWEHTLGRTEAHAHLRASSEEAHGLPRGVPGVVGRARMVIL